MPTRRRSNAIPLAVAGTLAAVVLTPARGQALTEPTAEERWSRFDQQAELIEHLGRRVAELEGEVSDLHGRLREVGADDSALDFAAERAAQNAAAIMASLPPESDGGYGSSLGEGLEIAFWGWLSYIYQDRAEQSTFWAWEVEMDVTKTFSDRLAAAIDIDVVDRNGGADVSIEQLFLSAMPIADAETVLTLGKFNAPFGVEQRDFWDRETASTSLLFREIPRDLTGVMITHPLVDTDFTLQGLFVNGADDNLNINREHSYGVVLTWAPDPALRVRGTYFAGPEMPGNVGDDQQIGLGEIFWQATPTVAVSAEYLYGTTETSAGDRAWWGALGIVNVDLDDRARIFARYSVLDDTDGFLTGVEETRQEAAVGAGVWLHPSIELRFEYRHGFAETTSDEDSIFAHITFDL